MIYLFLADGFEECEALVPLDILRRGGVEVKTVGIGKEYICGAHNITVKADIPENGICFDSLEAVILPGGMPGTLNLESSQAVLDAINYAYRNGMPVCAICAAPKILGGMGLLTDKKATCFPGFEKYLTGARLVKDFVVRDGNIITARGVGVAFEFGFAVLSALKGTRIADNLRLQMQYQGGLK